VISRKTAAAGFVKSDNTCSATDDEDNGSGCFDAGADHTYKLFLRTGDSLSVALDSSQRCIDSTLYDATLKIYAPQGAACAIPVANCDGAQNTGKLVCDDYVDTKARVVVAATDGWYSVIVDGSTAFDDEGDYKLTVKLTCITPACECP
jgi:hypothetical protein